MFWEILHNWYIPWGVLYADGSMQDKYIIDGSIQDKNIIDGSMQDNKIIDGSMQDKNIAERFVVLEHNRKKYLGQGHYCVVRTEEVED